MHSRRELLAGIAACLAAPAFGQLTPLQPASGPGLNGPVGLQLWSLREYLRQDLAGVLAKVRGMGFRDVEGAGLWGRAASDLRAALDAADLRCQSAHIAFGRLRDDPAGVFGEVKATGATWIVCPSIPHEPTFSRADALEAAGLFNRFAVQAAAQGLRFAYHCHGYEFVPSTEGTLFDTLASETDATRVMFQIDVFHAFFGGADPAALIDRYRARVVSLHLKDVKKGVPITAGTATAPPEAQAPVGAGQINMPAVLLAARKAESVLYYIEDESTDPWQHIPQSAAYLTRFGARTRAGRPNDD